MSGPPNQTPNGPNSWQGRAVLAAVVILVTIAALAVLAAIAIVSNEQNAVTLFNILLPVMATWVGTVLAFYFGRESFESASEQVRSTNAQLVQLAQSTQQEIARQPIMQVVRPIADMTYEQLGGNRTPATVTLAELRGKITDVITRMPVLTADLKPLYMIHASQIDKYLSDPQHPDTRTLEQFIDDEAQAGMFYDAQRGFALLAETASVADAKQSLEAVATVQDAFVTAKGTADEPLLGWVSNTRLSRYLKA
jgi:hypothetical protein